MSAIWPLIPFSCTPTLATLIYAAVLENHSVLTFVVRTIEKKSFIGFQAFFSILPRACHAYHMPKVRAPK